MYAFFCIFYFCFTAILLSQNTTNSFYVANTTPVFGLENSYNKKTEKKLATLYLKDNTVFVSLDKLTNTTLVFLSPKKNLYKKILEKYF